MHHEPFNDTSGQNAPRPLKGIRSSLVWLVVGAVLPLIIFGAFTAYSVFAQKMSAIARDLSGTASGLSVAVDREFVNQFHSLDVLASSLQVEGDTPARFNKLATQALLSNNEWLTLALIDPQTSQIIGGAPKAPQSPTYSLVPGHIAEVVRTQKPVIVGTFAKGKLSEDPMILLMIPVLREGKVRYVMGAAVKPGALSEIFLDQGMSDRWTGTVLDQKLVISGRSRDSAKYVGTPAPTSLQEKIQANTAGIFEATNKEGATIYTVYHRSALTGWSVVVGVPMAELDEPLYHLLMELVSAGVVLIFLTIAAALVVGRNIVAGRDRYESALQASKVELQEALDRLSKIAANLPGVVFQFRRSPDGRFSMPYASDAIEKLHQVKAAEVKTDADAVFAVVHPDDLHAMLESIEQSAQKLSPWSHEYRVQFANGEMLWLFGNALPQRESDGSILWHGFVSDMTAHKRVEDEVAQGEMKFQAILESAADAIFITDEVGHYVYVNSKAAQLLDIPREKLMGMHIVDITPLEEVSTSMQLFEQLQQGVFISAEFHLKRSDGALIPVEFNGTRLPDGKIYGSCRDISERIRTQNALRESESHLQTIFQTEPECICILDTAGHVRQINPAGLEILDAASIHDVVGQPLSSFVSAANQAEFGEMLQVVGNGSRSTLAFEIRSLNGVLRWLEAQAVPMMEQANSVILIVARDATQRRQAEAQLRSSREELSDLYENAPCGYHTMDRDGTIVRINHTELRWLGYSRDEVVGKLKLSDILDETSKNSYSQNFPNFLQRGGIRDQQLTFLRKDGSTFNGLISATAQFDASGRFVSSRSNMVDLTEHLRAEEQVRLAEDRFRMFFEKNSSVMLLINPASGCVVNANHAAAAFYGYSLKALIGMPVATINLLPKNEVEFEMQAARRESRNYFVFKHLLATGEIRDVEVYSTPIATPEGPLLLSIVHDITDRTLDEKRVHQLAFYDALTHLPNRRLLSDRLNQTMNSSKRSRRHCALMFIDLDNFKPINDQHGHAAGDLLLIEVANRIRTCIREIDTVARFGGDEFVVMLSELDEDQVTSEMLAKNVAEKIRLSLAQIYVIASSDKTGASTAIHHHCTASIGVVVFCGNENSENALHSRADAAMYQAKTNGRNQVFFSRPS